MGWDHRLSCIQCKEFLVIARNKKLDRQENALNLLEKFLIKHADHELIFDADDNYARVLYCSEMSDTNTSSS